MLARGNSDAAARLRRARSAPSVKPRSQDIHEPMPIHPDVTRQQAIAAAHHAFGVASNRPANDASRSQVNIPPRRRTQTRSSADGVNGKGFTRRQVRTMRSSETNKPLDRQSSIRFATTTATRKQDIKAKSSTNTLASCPQPQRYAPSVPSDQCKDVETDPLEIDEKAMLEQHGYASEPSSYRKLRKAKSMFQPGKLQLASQETCKPSPKPSATSRYASLGFKRSMSMLRGGGEHLARPFKRSDSQQHDVAIQLARDQFFNDMRTQNLRAKPSFLKLPRRNREQKSFRKSVRSGTNEDEKNDVDAIASLNKHLAGSQGQLQMSSKAMSVSSTFKRFKNIKNVFRKSSQEIPTQQIDASRPHFRDYVSSSPNIHNRLEDIPLPDEKVIARSFSREADSVRSFESLGKASGSRRDTHPSSSANSFKSRVTSWTNSTYTDQTSPNTMTRTSASAVDKKRLSMIAENGAYTDPSIARPNLPTSPGYDVFRRPLQSIRSGSQLSPPVDSHRVYSALMRRIDENHPQSVESFSSDRRTMLPIGAYDRPCVISQGHSSTIKAVSSNEKPVEHIRDQSVTGKREFSYTSTGSVESTATQIHHKMSHPEELQALTPQEIAHRNESQTRAKKTVRETKSAFFPSSNERKPHSPSPFRQAKEARKDLMYGSHGFGSEASLPNLTTPNRDRLEVASPSIYSRAAHSPGYPSGESESGGDGSPGMATITHQSSKQFHRSQRTQEPVLRDSAEIKSWASSQMAGLDRASSKTFQSMQHARPIIGHHREHAQIDNEDIEIGKELAGEPERSVKANAFVRQGSLATPPVSIRPPSDAPCERFPLVEIKHDDRRGSRSASNEIYSQPTRVSHANVFSHENVKAVENHISTTADLQVAANVSPRHSQTFKHIVPSLKSLTNQLSCHSLGDCQASSLSNPTSPTVDECFTPRKRYGMVQPQNLAAFRDRNQSLQVTSSRPLRAARSSGAIQANAPGYFKTQVNHPWKADFDKQKTPQKTPPGLREVRDTTRIARESVQRNVNMVAGSQTGASMVDDFLKRPRSQGALNDEKESSFL